MHDYDDGEEEGMMLKNDIGRSFDSTMTMTIERKGGHSELEE